LISSIGIISTWISLIICILLIRHKSAYERELYSRLLIFNSIFQFLLLEIGLLIDDFSIGYIANHSASSTPTLYKFASLWGALDGSILLWILCLSFYLFYHLKKFQNNLNEDYENKVFAFIILFFYGFVVFQSNPFAGCIESGTIGCLESTLLPFQDLDRASIGRGPNPLLQNHPLMAIHPPLLYMGYVGLSLPFAITLGSFINKNYEDWVSKSREASRVPWFFLTVGVSLGAAWSYEVLGWGGYWAWDPVENVSIIPWLLCTGFLHSAIVQRKNNSLINWNYVLIGLMFSSTIYGTFITRSGVLMSVHSFSNGPIGRYLLFGLFSSLIAFLFVGWRNEKYFKQSKKIPYLSGKFGLFTINNILLSVAAFIILIGTSYPIYFEVINQKQISIGREFYDQLVGPIFLFLIFLMVLGVNTKIKATNLNTIYEQENINLIISLIFSFILSFYIVFKLSVAVTMILSLWLVASITNKVIKFNKTKSKFGSDKTYWSGQIAHFGMAILSIGIILNMTQSYSNEYKLTTGETVYFNSQKYTLGELNNIEFEEKKVLALNIETKNKIIVPSINIFKNSFQQGISTPGINRGLFSDTYITIKSIEDENFKLIFKKNMGIQIIWLGMGIIAMSQVWKLRYGFTKK
tara:strand:+ start:31 stop:1938 length:1908 start_codon:yes stop_codon:yes gene_type:complete